MWACHCLCLSTNTWYMWAEIDDLSSILSDFVYMLYLAYIQYKLIIIILRRFSRPAPWIASSVDTSKPPLSSSSQLQLREPPLNTSMHTSSFTSESQSRTYCITYSMIKTSRSQLCHWSIMTNYCCNWVNYDVYGGSNAYEYRMSTFSVKSVSGLVLSVRRVPCHFHHMIDHYDADIQSDLSLEVPICQSQFFGPVDSNGLWFDCIMPQP